jgi:DNA invertase Pin-like site-specific DNA recombinase
MPKLALAYGRQSVARSRDARDGGSVSIAYQREAAERWLAQNDATLAGWFQDTDESGASTTRAGMDALFAETRRLKPDYVIFWDVKRLARNLKFFLEMFDLFADVGAELVSCTEGTRHPAFVWKMLALMAEEERDRIAVNITHGKRESAKRGRHSGYAPIGYLLTPTSELVIDPATRWIIEWMFARALAGENPSAICRAANAQGIPTRTGAQWSRETVTNLLIRPIYAGLVESGRASRSRYGRALGIVRAVGTHEAIIPLCDWETVQAAIAGASKPSARHGSPHWLSGRVRCAACGSRAYFVDAGRKGTPSRDRYFRCAATYKRTFGRDRDRSCPATKRRIAESALSPLVRDALYGALTRFPRVDDLLRQIETSATVTARQQRQDHERELAELQRQRTRISDAIQFGAGDVADLAQRDRGLIERIAAVQSALAATPVEPDVIAIGTAHASAHALALALPAASDDALAKAATQFGLSVTVDLDTGTVRLGFRDAYGWMAD